MRKLVAHVLCAAMLVTATAGLSGCKAEAQAEIKTAPQPKEEKAPPPEAPKPQKEEPKPALKGDDFEMESGHLKLPGPVLFETGKDVLKPESDAVLDVVKRYLEAKPQVTLMRIEGHTDNQGLPAANQTLSEGRAMAVARWLIGKGVACKRLLPVGFGQDKPVGDNKTPEGREANRRTWFVNAELKGKPIGGMPVDGGGKVAGDPCK